METDRTTLPARRCHHRDPERRRNGRWRGGRSQRVDENMPLLALDRVPGIEPVRIDASPPFWHSHTLTIDDACGGAPFRLLAAFDIERVMNAIQHAVAVPPNEVVVDRAARRKIFRKVPPLAAGAQDIHDPVHDRAHVGSPLAAAALGQAGMNGSTRPTRHPSDRLGISGDHDCISRGSDTSTSAVSLGIGPPSLNHNQFRELTRLRRTLSPAPGISNVAPLGPIAVLANNRS